MPFMHMQHMQPAAMHLVMQSQQAWHISQQLLSPLVQVKQTPFLVFVHSHLHKHRLHWHIIMPFIRQQQLHMPPASILHMFWSVVADISSSQSQCTFIPSLHCSNRMVQRVTMHMPGAAVAPGMPIGDCVAIGPIIIDLSIIIVVIVSLSLVISGQAGRSPWECSRIALVAPVRRFRTKASESQSALDPPCKIGILPARRVRRRSI
jgi:hypothetical protein